MVLALADRLGRLSLHKSMPRICNFLGNTPCKKLDDFFFLNFWERLFFSNTQNDNAMLDHCYAKQGKLPPRNNLTKTFIQDDCMYVV
jgi:hypothetical protein